MINELIIATTAWIFVVLMDKYFFKSDNMNKISDLFIKLKSLFRNKNSRMKPLKNNTHILKIRKKESGARYSWQLLEVLTHRVIIDNWEWKDTIVETISCALQLLYIKHNQFYDWITINNTPTIEWIYHFFEVTMENINN